VIILVVELVCLLAVFGFTDEFFTALFVLWGVVHSAFLLAIVFDGGSSELIDKDSDFTSLFLFVSLPPLVIGCISGICYVVYKTYSFLNIKSPAEYLDEVNNWLNKKKE